MKTTGTMRETKVITCERANEVVFSTKDNILSLIRWIPYTFQINIC